MWWMVVLCCWVAIASGCPQYCRCYTDSEDLKVANCSVSSLSSAHSNYNLDVLNVGSLFRGSSAKLEPRIFKNFRSLKYLNIRNASVTNLPNDIFYGLVNVLEIDLSFNKIRRLNGVVFRDLDSLESLILRGNQLVLSPFDVIVSQSLKEIDMSLCGLTKIPYDTFSSIKGLTHLDLHENELFTITYDTFPSTLTSLNLRKNQIINVPTEVLTSLRNLRSIDLSENPINCTCHLLLFQDRFSGQAGIFENEVTCAMPAHYTGQRLSRIDENELCRAEYLKRQMHLNSIKHRGYKSHRRDNMIDDPMAVQGDQPHMSGEYGNYNADAEVMFSNEDTRGLGSHMDVFGDEDSKLSTSEAEESKEYVSKEMVEPQQDLTKPDPAVETNTHSIDKVEKHSNEFNNFDVGSGEVENYHSDETITKSKTISSDEVSSIGKDEEENKITMPSGEPVGSESSNNVHALDVGASDGTTERSESDSAVSKILYDDTSMETATKPTPTAKLNLSWPTNTTYNPDYSYDTQHDDYYALEGNTTYADEEGVTEEIPADMEGSGSGEDDTTPTNIISSSIRWMEEQENETTSENYSVENVTEVFTVEIPSSTAVSSVSPEPTGETTAAVISSSESTLLSTTEVSSIEPTTEPSSSPEPSSSTESSPQPEIIIPIRSGGTSTVQPASSSTDSNESETIRPLENSDLNSNIISHLNVLEKEEGPMIKASILYIVIAAVAALVALLIFIIVCKKKKTGKIRLPQDPESNPGTEMQDMLLPKPPENGVKVLPKNYTNGSTPSNGRLEPHKKEDVLEEEEITPVLKARDDLDNSWELDKPEPIETVTARMTVLAKPQTPVFIHKTIN